MTKISMIQVYNRIYDCRQDDIKIAKLSNRENVGYNFDVFCKDLRKDDLVTTNATLKSKWDSAVADGIIVPYNGKYNRAWLLHPNLEHKLYKSSKNVCVCVSSNNTSAERNTKGAKA